MAKRRQISSTERAALGRHPGHQAQQAGHPLGGAGPAHDGVLGQVGQPGHDLVRADRVAPSSSAWSRKPSTNERKAGQLVTATSNTAGAVVAASRSTRVVAQLAGGPGHLVGVDQQAGRDLGAFAEPPRVVGQARAGLPARGSNAPGGPSVDRAGDAVEPEVPLVLAVVVEAGQVPVAPLVADAVRVDRRTSSL